MKRILKGKGVKKYRQSLVFGKKIVCEVLKRHGQYVTGIVVPEGIKNLVGLPPGSSIRVLELSKSLFKEIDQFKTNSPFLMVSRPVLPSWSGRLGPGCTLFVPFQDPENVGAVIRSAVAFGVGEIVLLQESADPFHPKSIRSSAGVVFGAPLSQGPALKDLNRVVTGSDLVRIFALHMEGIDIRDFRFGEGSFGLLPGLEGPGISGLSHTFQSLKIPMVGRVESLNAATAVAIALYEWSRRVMPPQE
ncbi:RNA methyltransferase, TrmH family [Thermodesulforhabdus norvegica]|uniref:RNA methyltransferase, TrmH family n=2 Tax=Thermodesulforhabdus norvegica TaxID=39841 RepID=A0A1I4V5Q7_9BACT|nr:RNA methyltransferase, TrmH family [Thermodesulforhabdus norvegica]